MGKSRAMAGCACSRCGRGLFGLFILSSIVSVLSTCLRETAMSHDIFNKSSSVIFCRPRPRSEDSTKLFTNR